MADYCLQCSVELGAPRGWSDFAPADEAHLGLCEGCGLVEIGKHGECLGVDEATPCKSGHCVCELCNRTIRSFEGYKIQEKFTCNSCWDYIGQGIVATDELNLPWHMRIDNVANEIEYWKIIGNDGNYICASSDDATPLPNRAQAELIVRLANTYWSGLTTSDGVEFIGTDGRFVMTEDFND